MKLNKISSALRAKNTKGRAALITSAFLGLLNVPAYADEESATKVVKKVDEQVEVIQVTGLRGTVTRSLNEKKNNSAIVDAIAAADFGDLPGLSLSDIIENVSGATGHRLKGSQNEISIRGLGSDFGYSTFNGRTITNAGSGRAVNFKKFPSELVDKVVVYKSQQANLVEGGTSGTIDVSSLRAVDYGKSQSVLNVEGVYNDYYSDVDGDAVDALGARITASTVQQWETDNFGDIGFTIGVQRSHDSNPEENFGGSSRLGVCGLRDIDGNELDDNGGRCSEDDSDSRNSEQAISTGELGRRLPNNSTEFDPSSIFFVPESVFWRTGEDQDVRENVVATLQWVPNDDLDINVDFQYSKLFYEERRFEVGIDNAQTNLSNHVISDDHALLAVDGTSRIDFNGENRTQLDTYKGGGINVAYTPIDDLLIEADLSYSESYRLRLRQRTNIRSGSQYDYHFDATGDVPSVVWEDGIDINDLSSFADEGGRLEYERDHDERNDDIIALKIDATYSLDNEFIDSIQTGFRYSEQHLLDYKDNDVSLDLNGNKQNDDPLRIEDTALLTQVIANCENDHQNDDLFEGGGSGQFATFDAKCLAGEVLNFVDGDGGVDGAGFYDIGKREDQRSGDDVDVTETIFAAYVMANIDTEIGDMSLTGNVGLRMVRNETKSEGFGEVIAFTTNPDGTFTQLDPTAESGLEDVDLESDYTEWLPSVNLSLAVSDDFIVRAAAYRAMSRFQLNAFASGVSVDSCQDDASQDSEDDSAIFCATTTDVNSLLNDATATGNHLNPYLSDNFDLSFEYYPSSDSAVTLALYWKNFTGGFESTTEARDIAITVDGVEQFVNVADVTVSQTTDNESTIKGYEITATKQFSELPAPFNGLGANVAYNYALSDFVTPEVASPSVIDDANLFGYSKQVASTSVYWEGDDVTVRLLYKYRSKYFQPNNLPFPDRSHRYVQDSDYLDFSAKYKFSKNLSFSFKALNLLDETQVYTRGNDTTIADYSRSGRKFFFGAKMKF